MTLKLTAPARTGQPPCKHIATVYYLLGEEFDRDPFLIFKLRGIDMDDFMSTLGKGSGTENQNPVTAVAEARSFQEGVAFEVGTETGAENEAEIALFSPEPLPLEPETFWGKFSETPYEEKSPSFEARIPPAPAILPKRLGKFPFWRGEEDLPEVLEDI